MFKLLFVAVVGLLALSVNATLPEKAKEEFRKIFAIVDVNNDGIITEEEVDALTGRVAVISEEEWKELIRIGDKDGDGKISFEEFLAYFENIVEENSRDVFSELDTDGDGVVSKDQLTQAGEDISENFATCDANNDGLITAEEFVECVKEGFDWSELLI